MSTTHRSVAETPRPPGGLATLLRDDRTVVVLGLAAVAAAAWIYTLTDAAHVHRSSLAVWTHAGGTQGGRGFGELAAMWTVMMIAMMLPTAWPMILLFVGVQRRRSRERAPLPATVLFVGGYLLAWTAFSVLAAGAQWGLGAGGLLSGRMETLNPFLGGAILVGAGAFQWSPLKEACLKYCRSPVGFVATHWKEGHSGSLAMGLHHGVYCVGCCWLLMLVLFVTGVMNVLWMMLLTLLTLGEKVVPARPAAWIRHGSGVGLVVWGAALILGAIVS